jgi:hypothetical protein
MKSILISLAAVLIFFITPLRADLVLKPNDVLAIAGDSITQQKIYTAFMEDYLLMCQPVEGLRVVQFGWGGEKTFVFSQRIQTDVLPFKPTVVTTCYGMNDGAYRAMDDLITRDFSGSTQQVINKFNPAASTARPSSAFPRRSTTRRSMACAAWPRPSRRKTASVLPMSTRR